MYHILSLHMAFEVYCTFESIKIFLTNTIIFIFFLGGGVKATTSEVIRLWYRGERNCRLEL